MSGLSKNYNLKSLDSIDTFWWCVLILYTNTYNKDNLKRLYIYCIIIKYRLFLK